MPTTEAKLVRVAVGVILRGQDICISLRPDHRHKGGYWEFPGGKIDAGESLEQALSRELQEELGIQMQASEPLMLLDWHYPEKSVRLEVLKVTEFSGEPQGLEGQQVRWVPLADLANYRFPEANQQIVDQLCR